MSASYPIVRCGVRCRCPDLDPHQMPPCWFAQILNRHSPDDSRTGVNISPHSPDNTLSFGAAYAIQISRSASYPGWSEAAMAHPGGEAGSDAVRLDFDRHLMLQFRGSLVTSDAGLLAYRELDDVLGLTEMAGDVLADARRGKNGRHALAGLFRQSVFGRLAGYEDVQSGAEGRGFAESDGALR